MKKLISVALLVAMALSFATMAMADGIITFELRVTTPFSSWTYTTQMADTLTIGDLRSVIRGMGRAKVPGNNDDPLYWHYSAGQTYVITVDGREKIDYEVNPGYVIIKGAATPKPSATKKPSSSGSSESRKSSGDITWSTEYLYQVYVNGRSYDFRVFGDGKKIAFKERFDLNDEHKMTGTLTVRGTYTELKPVYTEEAVEALIAQNISRIVITSPTGDQTIELAELLVDAG